MSVRDYASLRIVFLGTPEFASTCLQTLHEGGCQIVAVVTAPDKPAGRGMKLKSSAVKSYAVAHGIPVLQPEKLKDPTFLEQLRSYHADLQVVVAFRMLPELVWNMPPMGTINLHASLLPKYRGAAPINWAIINGENESGVTTFKLKQEIDTGNLLLQEKMLIGPEETAGELHDRMMVTGARLMLETIKGLSAGNLTEIPQTTSDTETHAPKIFSATCEINWNQPVQTIHDLIRGLSPYPAAFTRLEGQLFKIFACRKEITSYPEKSGKYEITDGALRFACSDGYIYPTEVQIEGKKKMPIDEFLRGFRGKSA